MRNGIQVWNDPGRRRAAGQAESAAKSADGGAEAGDGSAGRGRKDRIVLIDAAKLVGVEQELFVVATTFDREFLRNKLPDQVGTHIVVFVIRALRTNADFAGGGIGDRRRLCAGSDLRYADQRQRTSQLRRVKRVGNLWQAIIAAEVDAIAVYIQRIQRSGRLNRVAELRLGAADLGVKSQ